MFTINGSYATFWAVRNEKALYASGFTKKFHYNNQAYFFRDEPGKI
jgi:hypothetical protein